jgi:hypothetical protein
MQYHESAPIQRSLAARNYNREPTSCLNAHCTTTLRGTPTRQISSILGSEKGERLVALIKSRNGFRKILDAHGTHPPRRRPYPRPYSTYRRKTMTRSCRFEIPDYLFPFIFTRTLEYATTVHSYSYPLHSLSRSIFRITSPCFVFILPLCVVRGAPSQIASWFLG